MCLQVDMAPKQRMPQPRKDFWTPIDRTPVERPVVRSDNMTQDPNETQGGVDCQYVRPLDFIFNYYYYLYFLLFFANTFLHKRKKLN